MNLPPNLQLSNQALEGGNVICYDPTRIYARAAVAELVDAQR